MTSTMLRKLGGNTDVEKGEGTKRRRKRNKKNDGEEEEDKEQEAESGKRQKKRKEKGDKKKKKKKKKEEDNSDNEVEAEEDDDNIARLRTKVMEIQRREFDPTQYSSRWTTRTYGDRTSVRAARSLYSS